LRISSSWVVVALAVHPSAVVVAQAVLSSSQTPTYPLELLLARSARAVLKCLSRPTMARHHESGISTHRAVVVRGLAAVSSEVMAAPVVVALYQTKQVARVSPESGSPVALVAR
jgi:hypothetical protein